MAAGRRLPCFGKGEIVFLHQLPDPLQCQEGGVAFIHVANCGAQAQGIQGPYAAKAQEHLLLDPQLFIAAIKLVSDISILRPVGRDVGIQQVQRHATHVGAPNLSYHRPARIPHFNRQRCTARLLFQTDGQIVKVIIRVELLLPSVRVQILAEIALLVQQPHSHQWQPQVAGRLEMVAGQDAQAAGVDTQALGQTELCRKVCNPAVIVPPGLLVPGCLVVEIPPELLVYAVAVGHETVVFGHLLQPLLPDGAKNENRIMSSRLPQVAVQPPEQVDSFVIPAPPQVPGQLSQPLQFLGQ